MMNPCMAVQGAACTGPERQEPLHLAAFDADRLLTRRLASGARGAGNAALFPLVLLREKIDRRPTIRSLSALKPDSLGPKVAILCHYDRAGRLRDDFRHYILELSHAGFAVILASNSRHLDPQAQEFADRHCAGVMLRRNVGFDFAAWKDAIGAHDLPRPGTTLLLLANDSLYGPSARSGRCSRKQIFPRPTSGRSPIAGRSAITCSPTS